MKTYQDGYTDGKQEIVDRLLAAVCEVEGISKERQIKKAFGVKTTATVNHWKKKRAAPTKNNLVRLLRERSRLRITGLAEFERINPVKKGAGWVVDADDGIREAWKERLKGKRGVFVFYDSRGSVTYIGQTTKQDFFTEIEQDLRQSKLRGTHFTTALAKHSEHKNSLCQGEVTRMVSVYEVHDQRAIHNVEALMIRGLMNNLFNRSTEEFKW